MTIRQKILKQICYTDLVYGRINKKLKTNMARDEIETFIADVVSCEESLISKIGKNYYVENKAHCVRITINASTFRVITADKL
ncbi:hypothetical protein Hs30E_00900 [Lactococcus hodotermopsidis]|uniref:DUF3781 domain-containing protein n=1 Tax=Pseudolactococcus hodotermopsidis TaxID=2709157 RepID=A0A6A0B7Z9_9LACT|nr:DUF3781 domain-containing protein [Lactococcus hodotermopsidis]GFH41539.1 hypothetical protein Hs30E_00900 [Lactococcus hodotermopsidis]